MPCHRCWVPQVWPSESFRQSVPLGNPDDASQITKAQPWKFQWRRDACCRYWRHNPQRLGRHSHYQLPTHHVQDWHRRPVQCHVLENLQPRQLAATEEVQCQTHCLWRTPTHLPQQSHLAVWTQNEFWMVEFEVHNDVSNVFWPQDQYRDEARETHPSPHKRHIQQVRWHLHWSRLYHWGYSPHPARPKPQGCRTPPSKGPSHHQI